MQTNLSEVRKCNQKPCMNSAAKSSLESRCDEFINGVVNDLSYEFKAFLRYELHKFLDCVFNISN